MAAREPEVRAAWRRHVGTSSAATAVLESVLARHREPHRRYHGVGHVAWVLRHLATLSRSEPHDDLGAIVAAACFHDAVYDPRAVDNEAASARLARTSLAGLGWPAERVEHVVSMVEATAGHVTDAASSGRAGATVDADTAVLLDADLAVLGSDPAAYLEYSRGVRAEYAHVDDTAWRDGRAAVLRTLLARRRVYLTATARERWEVRARANLRAELASLEPEGR